MNRFRFKACGKCGGDLALDEGDWLCLQCGVYYYTGLYPGRSAWPRHRVRPSPARERGGPLVGAGRRPGEPASGGAGRPWGDASFGLVAR